MSGHQLTSKDAALPPTELLVDGGASGGRLTLVALTLASGQDQLRHRHHWEDELIVVVAGRLDAWIDGTWLDAGAGDHIFLPRGSEHALVATTDETRLLIAFTPAGFEGYYRELAEGAAGAGSDLAWLIRVAARYGVEVTGPPPPPRSHPPSDHRYRRPPNHPEDQRGNRIDTDFR